MRRFLCLFLTIILFMPLLSWAEETNRGLTLLAVNVGKADCLILHSGESVYMIDTGSAQSWGAVSAALKLNGITALDGVIVTHTDKDHAGGVWALATSSIPVGAWYASGYYCEVSEEEHPVALAAALRGETVHWLLAGDTLPLDGGSLRVIGPTAYFDDKENNNSLVLYAQTDDGTMLLAGDMEQPAEELLLASGVALRADVLKVGHHGEGDATSEAFARAVSPQVAVISTNSVDEPDTPSKRVLKALKAAGARTALTETAPGGVLVTLKQGSATCTLESWTEPPAAITDVVITGKDNQADTVTFENTGSAAVDLSGWFVFSDKGNEILVLPDGTVLAPGESLTIGSLTTSADVDLIWPDRNVWHNSKTDTAILFDVYGREISRFD